MITGKARRHHPRRRVVQLTERGAQKNEVAGLDDAKWVELDVKNGATVKNGKSGPRARGSTLRFTDILIHLDASHICAFWSGQLQERFVQRFWFKMRHPLDA